MSSKTIIHLFLAFAYGLAVLWVMGSWSAWSEDGAVVHQLLSILLLATTAGFYVVLVLLPRFGDAVGTAMLSSGEEVKIEGASKAQGLIACGDYNAAIKEYEKMLAENPDDAFTVSEVAKVQSEKLRNPAGALATLQHHLEGRSWVPDDAAFLMFRIVELHTHENHFPEARSLLEEVMANFPNTRHSANARHKMSEVEQAEFKQAQAKREGRAQR